MSGEPLGQPPYRYIKSPDNRKKWFVDDEAAAVVKKIYFLFLSGFGIEQIAIKLTDEKVLTPTEYAKHKKISKPTSATMDIPNYWRKATVAKILSNQEYCGDIINFKTYIELPECVPQKNYKADTRQGVAIEYHTGVLPA